MSKGFSRRQFLQFGSGALITAAIGTEISNPVLGQNGGACFWNDGQAQAELSFLYGFLLERGLDESGRRSYTAKLKSGSDWAMRFVVQDIAESPEYNDRFIKPYLRTNDPGGAIRRLYVRLLYRLPENEVVVGEKLNDLYRYGLGRVVRAFTDSPEYLAKWGNSGTPGRSYYSDSFGCYQGFDFCPGFRYTVFTRNQALAERIARRAFGGLLRNGMC
jgi:hypothetical protein